ncbi:MAG: glycosyltransferase family 4 protein [Pseudomonadota bacterium]
MVSGVTAILVKGYPRLSETFIAQEILGLQQRGQKQIIVSLRHPTDKAVHDLNRQITAPVLYLPEYLYEEPERVEAARDWARSQPGYERAYCSFREDYKRDRTPNRWRRFGQACVLAKELPDQVDFLYVNYLHTPTSVARYAGMIRGLPYAVSAHAKDIWTSPQWEIREKLADAQWLTTCTKYNVDYLRGLTDKPDKVFLTYHGLDFSRFPDPTSRPRRDGTSETDPVRLLTIGRAVEKKGLDVLLAAVADLPDGLNWRLDHIGGGPLLADLERQAKRLGLADRVAWRGPQTQDRVIEALMAADLFVMAARPAADGDRDGLPNVLMEAQATGLACLATDFSAIPELIDDGVTGGLVPPDNAPDLAKALASLISSPAERERLGADGAQNVRAKFDFHVSLDRLAERFGL